MSTSRYADRVMAIGVQVLGNDAGNRYVGSLARSQAKVISHQLGARFLNVIGDGGVAGRVLDAEVVDADRPDQVLGVQELGIGVRNGPHEPALARVGLPALQLV